MNQRTCHTCGETKDLNAENFYPSKYHEHGYNTQCRKCNIAKTLAKEKERRESSPYFKADSEAEKERIAEAKEFYRKRAIDDLLKKGLHHCKKCGLDLPVGVFAKNKDAYSKLQSICRSCKEETRK